MNNTIILKTYTSYEVLDKLKEVVKDSWTLKEVRMEYNTRELPDERNVDSYPCTLVFADGQSRFKVKILSLTVGYGGAGPTAFAQLLEYFGIEYDEDAIFTKRDMEPDGFIRLWYLK